MMCTTKGGATARSLNNRGHDEVEKLRMSAIGASYRCPGNVLVLITTSASAQMLYIKAIQTFRRNRMDGV